jgi:hypothetical protein
VRKRRARRTRRSAAPVTAGASRVRPHGLTRPAALSTESDCDFPITCPSLLPSALVMAESPALRQLANMVALVAQAPPSTSETPPRSMAILIANPDSQLWVCTAGRRLANACARAGRRHANACARAVRIPVQTHSNLQRSMRRCHAPPVRLPCTPLRSLLPSSKSVEHSCLQRRLVEDAALASLSSSSMRSCTPSS